MHFSWFFLLLMATKLACLEACGRKFATSQAFKVHKASCDHVKAALTLSAQEAQSAPDHDGHAIFLEKRAAKRRRENPVDPEPQTSPSQPTAGWLTKLFGKTNLALQNLLYFTCGRQVK
jgi:hypothetical protein